MVRQLHYDMMARITDIGKVSEAFAVTNSVKQGCVLSPTYFKLMFSVMLMDAYLDERSGSRINYRTDGHLLNSRRMQTPMRVSTTSVHDMVVADNCALNIHIEVLERTKTLSIHNVLRQVQQRWSGHLVRIDGERLPKRLFYGDVATGARQQGDQKRRYKETLKKYLKQLQINPATWEDLARDRPACRRSMTPSHTLTPDTNSASSTIIETTSQHALPFAPPPRPPPQPPPSPSQPPPPPPAIGPLF
ncbi:unnamed protein product [Schistocephalus solidus]|uniref:Reverse transcriptase domain-containing protein n=1 Tax=Schistocephalus solidus TaxID=70667 RepID=A0A183SJ75_SCHSO|nr:unnamed protein product [Schistocephalus solidus]